MLALTLVGRHRHRRRDRRAGEHLPVHRGEARWTSSQAAVEATEEIGLAVLATTLSLVAIFVPVGVHGRHRRPLHEELRPDDGVRDHGVAARQLHADADAVGALAEGRRSTARTSTRRRTRGSSTPSTCSTRGCSNGRWRTAAIVAGVAVLVLLSSVPLFMIANKNFMPQDDQSEFEINLRAPEGTSLESTEVLTNRVADAVRAAAARGRLHAGHGRRRSGEDAQPRQRSTSG